MRIQKITEITGPNVFHYRPVLVMRLDLEALAGCESHELPGFNAHLLDRLPGLHAHQCSRGRAGGFVERLHEGTYFGHVVEHVAIELSQQAGIGVNFGKTVCAGPRGVYDVAVRYRSAPAMRLLLETAVELVTAMVAGKSYPLDERVAQARQLVAEDELGPSTRAIVDAAERRGIPTLRIGDESLVQLGYGRHRKFIQAATTSGTSQIAVDLACNKHLAKQMLDRAMLPVPRGEVVRTAAEAVAAAQTLGGPVVVKPLDGNQGKGVTVGVETPEEIRAAFDRASQYGSRVIVEQQFEGVDYRVLVVGGKMVAASERQPCHVVGDGVHTVLELVEIENRNPLRGEGHEKPLTRITLDEAVQKHLARQGLTLCHIPEADQCVFLRAGANLSQGGTARDVTDEVHPETQLVCERAARAVGLDVCGVDLVTPDIRQPIPEGQGGIVEINAAPGLRMHLYPSEGQPRAVGEAIVNQLYPNDTTGRIPICAVTGTNGKTTVTRLIAHLLGSTGRTVGMTSTDGIYVGSTRIAKGDLSGPSSAQTVLSDPSVELAVLETARGGIARRGLGYDWSDVAVLTNLQADHIGQDGIRSIEDLMHVKSLVAERVREGGTLVLNAEDDHLDRMVRHPRIRRMNRRLIYFSLDPDHERIRRHRARGGTAFFVRDGWIIEARGVGEGRLLHVSAIPLTLGGHARFQIANCLAAIAACRAMEMPRPWIITALRTFEGNAHNEGRTNVFQLEKGHVLVDYGHNAPAFRAVCEMVAPMRRKREVIGIVGVPGDRADALVTEAGAAAAHGFDRIIVREDHDLRDRAPGEIAGLLTRAIRRERPDVPCQTIPDACDALRAVLPQVREGALAVVFYEHLQPLLDCLQEAGAVPATLETPQAPALDGTTAQGDGASGIVDVDGLVPVTRPARSDGHRARSIVTASSTK